MSAVYSIYTSPNHAPIPNHLPTLIVTPHGQPHHTLYSYIHTNYNKETYLLTPSPQGDLCVAKMVPPAGSRGPRGPGQQSSDSNDPTRDRSVRCEASRNLKWSITNTGINAPVYKLTLPNPDQPGTEQPLFQISKPNPKASFWTMFYFTYAGHLIPPRRVEFGKIQKNAAGAAAGGPNGAGAGSAAGGGGSGGGGTRVTITGKSAEEKAVWQTLGEGNEDMVEWIVLCAALNVLDDEILKAAEKHSAAIAASAPSPTAAAGPSAPGAGGANSRPGARPPASPVRPTLGNTNQRPGQQPQLQQPPQRPGGVLPPPMQQQQRPAGMPIPPAVRSGVGNIQQRPPGAGGQRGYPQQPQGGPAPGQGRGMPMPMTAGRPPLPGAAMPAPGPRRY
ncbi:hypothetical protein V8E36_001283 [Tilletia maclaganii]